MTKHFAPFNQIIQPFDIPVNEQNYSLFIYIIQSHTATI